MARYYFHIRDRWGVIPDDEGMELLTLGDAYAEAGASADDLTQSEVSIGGYTIDIEDDAGQTVGTMLVPRRRMLA